MFTELEFRPHRLRRQLELSGYRPGSGDDYPRQIREIQAFVRGDYQTLDGLHLRTPVAEGADLDLWICAVSPGESARTAGRPGLPLSANYHAMPAAILDTIRAYRADFCPAETLSTPHVMVSADVVAEDHDHTDRVRSYELLARAWEDLA